MKIDCILKFVIVNKNLFIDCKEEEDKEQTILQSWNNLSKTLNVEKCEM